MADPIPPAQTARPRRFRFFRTVSALMLREMLSTYGRSPGGYLWAILEPIGGIALLSIVFALVMRSPQLGSNFPLFFATGLLVFQLYTIVANLVAASIRYSRAFLAYPAVTFFDALIARFLLNTLTQCLVMAIILGGIVLIYDLKLILRWDAIFNAIAMALCFAFGVGVMNCYLFNMAPLWERIWQIANRPMFILAGVLFIPEIIPAQFRDYFMMNPLPHMTSEMRRGFYATYDAVYVDPVYVYVISAILVMLGLVLLLRNHKTIAET